MWSDQHTKYFITCFKHNYVTTQTKFIKRLNPFWQKTTNHFKISNKMPWNRTEMPKKSEKEKKLNF